MTKQLVHRKSRRERGLCVVEGCPVVTGDEYRCPAHAANNVQYTKRWRQKATGKKAS